LRIAALRENRRVEHHALAEDRRHEGVGGSLVEVLLLGPEEELVGLGAGQQDDVAVGQTELADVAAGELICTTMIRDTERQRACIDGVRDTGEQLDGSGFGGGIGSSDGTAGVWDQ
jgi:hypothetical protein